MIVTCGYCDLSMRYTTIGAMGYTYECPNCHATTMISQVNNNGFNCTQLDEIELALLHAESILMNDTTPDGRICYARVRKANNTLRSASRHQDPSPVHGPGRKGDQLRGVDQ